MWISFRLSKTVMDGSSKESFSRGSNRSESVMMVSNRYIDLQAVTLQSRWAASQPRSTSSSTSRTQGGRPRPIFTIITVAGSEKENNMDL